MSEDFELRETNAEVSLDWKIKEFSSLPKAANYFLDSPTFSLSGAKWFIKIYPDGHTGMNNTGWVSLFLNRKCSSYPKHNVAYTLGIRNGDGEVYRSQDVKMEFLTNTGYGNPKLLQTSELNDSKNVVSKEGSLTVFCKARVITPRIVDEKVSETASQTSSLESVQILQQNFKDLFLSAREGDVTIKVKDQEFQAHRLILSARSRVFFSMFDHDTEEKKTGIVNIPDCDPESFKDFLSFVYTGELDVVSLRNAVGLYKIADKYDLNDLKTACVCCMTERLSVESFCDIVLLATMYDESKLMEAAIDFFSENVKKILPTSSWQSLVEEHFTITNELLIKMANKKL